MKNNFQDKIIQFIDPLENYFECISSCDINDGICVSKCVEILRDDENYKFN